MNEELMTPREKRAVNNRKPTKGDLARKDRILEMEAEALNDSKLGRNAFRKAAKKKITVVDDDGTLVEVNKIDAVARNYFNFLAKEENAGKISVKDILAIDDPDKNVVSLETAADVFGGIRAVGAKPNGSDSGQSQ